MSNNSHTPGPWRANAGQVWAANGMIADCGHHIPTNLSGVADMFEGQANALLIAAAPELLEALEELVSRRESACAERGEMDRLGGSDGRYNRARAAIAKAKGDAQ